MDYILSIHLSIISIISLVTGIVVSITTCVHQKRQDKKDYQLRQLDLNYQYKMNCYAELLAMFLYRGDDSPEVYIQQLHLLTAKTVLLCNANAKLAIDNLLSKVEKGRFTESFYHAFSLFVDALKSDLQQHPKKP